MSDYEMDDLLDQFTKFLSKIELLDGRGFDINGHRTEESDMWKRLAGYYDLK